MNAKDRFIQIRQYVQKKWFNIALIVLAALLVLDKDLSIRFNLKAPLDKEQSGFPAEKPGDKSKSGKKNKFKVTESLGASASKSKSTGSLADPFNNLFTPASIPDQPHSTTKNEQYEVSPVSPEQVSAFIQRFGAVAQNEMKKFGIPASIILGQALLSSHAGVNQVSKTSNNFFGLPCTPDWADEKIELNGMCYRKYETAWFSFRDHSTFLSTGKFKQLRHLDHKDYHRWAKGLELAGYNSTPGYSQILINTIKEFNLGRYDQ